MCCRLRRWNPIVRIVPPLHVCLTQTYYPSTFAPLSASPRRTTVTASPRSLKRITHSLRRTVPLLSASPVTYHLICLPHPDIPSHACLTRYVPPYMSASPRHTIVCMPHPLHIYTTFHLLFHQPALYVCLTQTYLCG